MEHSHNPLERSAVAVKPSIHLSHTWAYSIEVKLLVTNWSWYPKVRVHVLHFSARKFIGSSKNDSTFRVVVAHHCFWSSESSEALLCWSDDWSMISFAFHVSTSVQPELLEVLTHSETLLSKLKAARGVHGGWIHEGWTASSFQTVLYLRVLLFNLVTPEGFFDDREPFAIAMFLSRADLRDASSLLLFVLATWTKGPVASVLGSSELVRQKPWHFLSAELKHSHRSADRRRRDGGLPRP